MTDIPPGYVDGKALACLYAADRYHHLETEIRPKLVEGVCVITDRYVASGLVMQRLDGVDLEFLWQLNAKAVRPDLSVILSADPAVIERRLHKRGPHNRYQRFRGSTQAEVGYYDEAADHLTQVGFNILRLDCSLSPDHVAAEIMTRFPTDSDAPG
jgi:dTMP kinase